MLPLLKTCIVNKTPKWTSLSRENLMNFCLQWHENGVRPFSVWTFHCLTLILYWHLTRIDAPFTVFSRSPFQSSYNRTHFVSFHWLYLFSRSPFSVFLQQNKVCVLSLALPFHGAYSSFQSPCFFIGITFLQGYPSIDPLQFSCPFHCCYSLYLLTGLVLGTVITAKLTHFDCLRPTISLSTVDHYNPSIPRAFFPLS